MRLSSVLSDNNNSFSPVQSFIDKEKFTDCAEDVSEDIIAISSGDFIELQIGKVNVPFFSINCNDNILFTSSKKLHCLIVNNQLISIDCVLKCSDHGTNAKCSECAALIQAWFLIEADDIFANNPNVRIIKYNFRLPEHIKLLIENEDTFSELLGKAEIAYKERLGAGSIIYLRAAFEKITHQVGIDAGIPIYKVNGKSKPFDQILRAVDGQCSIIPRKYSENGYELFCKLSEIAHGNSDEKSALEQYYPLRRLVMGVIDNVKKHKEDIKNNEEIRTALNAIGFADGGELD